MRLNRHDPLHSVAMPMDRNSEFNLDEVTTIAIGNMDSDGNFVSDWDWFAAQSHVVRIAEDYGMVVAVTEGPGLTSDQPGVEVEDSFVCVVINVTNQDKMREDIAYMLSRFDMSSAAYSTDYAHEPVFNTPSGWRPSYGRQASQADPVAHLRDMTTNPYRTFAVAGLRLRREARARHEI